MGENCERFMEFEPKFFWFYHLSLDGKGIFQIEHKQAFCGIRTEFFQL